jgi:hypothetical protein
MKRWIPWVLGLVLVVASLGPVLAARTVKFGNTTAHQVQAPVRFTSEPRMAEVPGTRVAYMLDESEYDVYRLATAWYLVDRVGWYRASSWRGPFARIDVRAVPREILRIPAGYRKNWVAPTV